MARIFNLGSLNLDHVYRVTRFVQPGETLAVADYTLYLGGKGLNHSVAAARSGAQVTHIGCAPVAAMDEFERAGHAKLTWHIRSSDIPAGHAIIQVDDQAENQILLYAGANHEQDLAHIQSVSIAHGDIFLAQNETNLVPQALSWAKGQGATIAYAAAPFDAEAVRQVLHLVDILAMNDIEAQQLTQSLSQDVRNLGVDIILVTKGSKGVDLYTGGEMKSFPAFKATPVDTTGAGDCFFGSFLSQIAQGAKSEAALTYAQAASAIKVTRAGAALAFPEFEQVKAFLDDQR